MNDTVPKPANYMSDMWRSQMADMVRALPFCSPDMNKGVCAIIPVVLPAAYADLDIEQGSDAHLQVATMLIAAFEAGAMAQFKADHHRDPECDEFVLPCWPAMYYELPESR